MNIKKFTWFETSLTSMGRIKFRCWWCLHITNLGISLKSLKISNWEVKPKKKTPKRMWKSFSPHKTLFICKRCPQKLYLTPLYRLGMFGTNLDQIESDLINSELTYLKTLVRHGAINNVHCSIVSGFNCGSPEPCGSYCCS